MNETKYTDYQVGKKSKTQTKHQMSLLKIQEEE